MSNTETLARWLANTAANYGGALWAKYGKEGKKRVRKVAARLLDSPPPVLLKAVKEKAR